jgi:two-component system, cell cycle sensor histidine kinase and response regulator CckA
MFDKFKIPGRSISKEVSMGLIITIILVSTLSFFIAHKVSQKKAQDHLNAKADEYISYLREFLIFPIWNYDNEAIEVIGNSYLQNDYIAGIKITDSRGETSFSVFKPDLVPLVTRNAHIEYLGQRIGAVNIALSSGYFNVWNRQFFWYFGFIILINLLSLIIMTGFLLRWSLNKPLQLLNRIVASYDSRDRIVINQNVPYTEFMPLINTLDGMGSEIQLRMTELRKAEKKYRSIFENATEGIFQSTLEGKIINANPAFAKILGYSDADEVVAQVFDIASQHYVNPKQRKEFLITLKEQNEVKSYEVQFKKKDHSIIWVSINAISIYDARGEFQYLEGLVQDITIRKKAATQLQRLSTAVEQVAENIIITDAEGIIKYVNPAFEQSTGFSFDNMYNTKHRLLGSDETDIRTYDEILRKVKMGKVWTGRITNRKKSGDPIIEEAIVSPIKNPEGRFLGYVSINRDITIKAQYEVQVRQSQKMEAIGTLAGGIAHDFNNILGVIIGCSELVKKDLNHNDKALKDIEQILTAGMRAQKLVSQILTFSRQKPSKKIPLMLRPFIKEIINFLKATLPKFIKIKLTCHVDTSVVLADPIQLQQILMNLCTNASQAIGSNRGIIEVILSQVDYTHTQTLPLGIKPGVYVMIKIKDDGPGISEKIKHKIYDPFFTTKGVGEGTGLGLSVVHGIIQKHDGRIFVESKEGKGTCFSVVLPQIDHVDIQIDTEQIIDLPDGTEKILLVDDEKVLLDIIDRILSNLGYDVHAYDNSKEALDAFLRNPGGFDLIVTDQIMPEMTGTRLIEQIRSVNPTVPIILFTGLNETELESFHPDQTGYNRIVKKPLRNADFAFIIRKVLDEKCST